MKRRKFILLAPAIFSGCAILQNPDSTTRICNAAAYDIADELLAEKPERRPAFEKALASLRTLQAQPYIDLQAVLTVLRQIPVAALQSRRARIAFDAGELVIVLAGDPAVNPKSEVTIRAAVTGFIYGLERRLNQA